MTRIVYSLQSQVAYYSKAQKAEELYLPHNRSIGVETIEKSIIYSTPYRPLNELLCINRFTQYLHGGQCRNSHINKLFNSKEQANRRYTQTPVGPLPLCSALFFRNFQTVKCPSRICMNWHLKHRCQIHILTVYTLMC